MLAIIVTCSLVLFMFGFFLFTNDVLNNRLKRYTTWRELKPSQWLYVGLVGQALVVLGVALIYVVV